MLWTAALAQAHVTITCDRKEVRSREEAILRVASDDGLHHDWRWSLLDPDSPRPTLKPISRTEVRVTAPPTRNGRTVKVLVEEASNASIRAEFQLTVGPNAKLGCTEWQEKDERVPGAFTPSLCPFQDEPHRPSKVCFCDEAFAGGPKAMRSLNRCWFVAGAEGLQAFSLAGDAVPVPGVPQPGPGRVCRAVAVLPPGARPGPDAPRLVYSEARPEPFAPDGTADEDTRIFALDAGGSRRELDLGEVLTSGGPRVVRDLSLDLEGNVYAILSGGRGLWKVDPAGRVTLHALIPESATLDDPGHPDLPGGILALVLDAATGDLYVGDGYGVQRVTSAGVVNEVLPGGRSLSPSHLALHGRELLIGDARRHKVHVLHLDTRRLATVLGGTGERGCARLGPVRVLNPGLPAESCAALGRAGALASNQEGLCLLATGEGLALLELPRDPLTQVLTRPENEGRPAAPSPPLPRLATRQASLVRHRSIQTRLRQYHQELRLGEHLAARTPEPKPAAPAQPASSRRRAGTGWNRQGVCLLALMACATLLDPSTTGALAQAPPVNPVPPFLAQARAQTAASLGQLGLTCGPILLSGQTPPPCDDAYQTELFAQLNNLFAQMETLLVDPATLGAGACLPGEPIDSARARIALDQGDILASYDGLIADGTAVQYRLIRDGFLVQAVGAGLLSGQAGAYAVGAPVAGPGGALGAALGITGSGLTGGGLGLQALGGYLGGRTVNMAVAARAQYQRYANNQSEAILQQCASGSAAPGSGPRVPAAGPGGQTPIPALGVAIERLDQGCTLAGQHLLNLPVCSPDSLASLRSHNGTLSELFQSVACLANGLLEGRQGPCRSAPLSDARTRSDTFSYFLQYTGEVSVVGWELYALGSGFHAATQGLFAGSDLAALLDSPAAAEGLLAGGLGLGAVGHGLLADAFELLRTGAVAQRWLADVTHAFNAQSRAQLDEMEESAPAPGAGVGTGTSAPMGTAEGVVPGPAGPAAEASSSTGAGLVWTGRDETGPGQASVEPSTSGAGRARPLLSWVVALFTEPSAGRP